MHINLSHCSLYTKRKGKGYQERLTSVSASPFLSTDQGVNSAEIKPPPRRWQPPSDSTPTRVPALGNKLKTSNKSKALAL